MLFIVGVASALTVIAATLERVLEPEQFHSVDEAAWWAVQTVSTVGYGDIVPATRGGRAIAAAIMLVGIAIVPALTSTVVTLYFRRVEEEREREMLSELDARLDRIERAVAPREGGVGPHRG